MQQDGYVVFERVVHKSPLQTWHIVVALLIFAGLICAFVWWSRRRSEKNLGTLSLGKDRGD